jgi:hypothetical protein
MLLEGKGVSASKMFVCYLTMPSYPLFPPNILVQVNGFFLKRNTAGAAGGAETPFPLYIA